MKVNVGRNSMVVGGHIDGRRRGGEPDAAGGLFSFLGNYFL